MALQTTIAIAAAFPEELKIGLKVEDMPGWIARKSGVDEALIRSPEERQELMEKAAEAAQAMAEMQPQMQAA